MFYYFNAEMKYYERPTPVIKPFATATDAELADMLQAHYDGLIDLHTEEGWDVGAERTVRLGAMLATGVDESHVEQDVTMVLMNKGGKTLSDGTTECAFIVGQKNSLLETGYMNSTLTSSGGWKNSARRTWCNSVYYNAIPSGFKALLKEFTNQSGLGGGSSSGVEDTLDYCALPAEVEVFGSQSYSVAGEGTRFKYYETSENRIKKLGDSGSTEYWWERSPCASDSMYFCNVLSNGNANKRGANSSYNALAPFFVI